MYSVTSPPSNICTTVVQHSTLHAHLAAVLQTGRPSSTPCESRDTFMSPDLTSCSSLRYTKECAAVGSLAGAESRRLARRQASIHRQSAHSKFGIWSLRWLSRTRQSQIATGRILNYLHSLIRRSPQTRESVSHSTIGTSRTDQPLGACHGSGMPRNCP
jgi:hypothetical protein